MTKKSVDKKDEAVDLKKKNLKTETKTEQDKSKVIRKKKTESVPFKTLEVVILMVMTCIVSLIVGYSISYKKVENNPKPKKDQTLSKFVETYNYILDNYFEDLDKEELIKNAIEGMIANLDDEFSSYLDDETSDNFNISIKGSYYGLGVEIISDKDNNAIIYSVFSDSPASKAGLKSNDLIKTINGENVEGKGSSYVSNLVRKGSESKFEIEIIRDNESITLNINRDLVELQSVAHEGYEKNDKKIGYIYVSLFAANTDEQYKKALDELTDIDGLIIDLRGNSGGDLSVADKILSFHLDRSNIIYQTESKTDTEIIYSKGKKTTSYPVVVLINNNSASASEIVTAAMQEKYGATVVGTNSYGKGTIQELKEIFTDSSDKYKITTKKWLTPSGKWIDKQGIKPDIKVELDDEYLKNPSPGTDKQLQTAIDHIIKTN